MHIIYSNKSSLISSAYLQAKNLISKHFFLLQHKYTTYCSSCQVVAQELDWNIRWNLKIVLLIVIQFPFWLASYVMLFQSLLFYVLLCLVFSSRLSSLCRCHYENKQLCFFRNCNWCIFQALSYFNWLMFSWVSLEFFKRLLHRVADKMCTEILDLKQPGFNNL